MTNSAAEVEILERYGAVAKALHWSIAILILIQIPLGLKLHGLPNDAFKFSMYQLHKSFGITVLLLMILRVIWRFAGKTPPALPANMPRLEKLGAHAGHFTLYILSLLVPLAGWALVSASKLNIPTLLYQTIPWPHIPWLAQLPLSDKLIWEPRFALTHSLLAKLLLAVIILHILAALRHAFVLRDGIITRMLPTFRRK